jgi:4a-hydroxytetrahydrobiopterin dehydratase
MKILTEIEIQNALLSLEGWKMEKGGIIKSFVLENFKSALDTMNKIGEVAEEMNHHPEWFNVYNKLDIRLSTHDKGGITQLDIDLAKAIEEIVNN